MTENMELNKGDRVLVHIENGGVFSAVVDHFARDGVVAILMPTRDPVRDVFPGGYELGRAHWSAMLTKITDAPVSAGAPEDRLANGDGSAVV